MVVFSGRGFLVYKIIWKLLILLGKVKDYSEPSLSWILNYRMRKNLTQKRKKESMWSGIPVISVWFLAHLIQVPELGALSCLTLCPKVSHLSTSPEEKALYSQVFLQCFSPPHSISCLDERHQLYLRTYKICLAQIPNPSEIQSCHPLPQSRCLIFGWTDFGCPWVVPAEGAAKTPPCPWSSFCSELRSLSFSFVPFAVLLFNFLPRSFSIGRLPGDLY